MPHTDQGLFYMIARLPSGPHSRTEPKARFDSFAAAQAQADQLAQDTGHPHVVLAVVAVLRPRDTRTGSLFA